PVEDRPDGERDLAGRLGEVGDQLRPRRTEGSDPETDRAHPTGIDRVLRGGCIGIVSRPRQITRQPVERLREREPPTSVVLPAAVASGPWFVGLAIIVGTVRDVVAST